MILIVADTGPIQYLVQIGVQDVLGRLVDHVVLPSAVVAELSHPQAPPRVRDWVASLPDWVEIKGDIEIVLNPSPALSAADQQSICMARELNGLLLMDERVGRRYAHSLGVKTIGTLGLLELAGERGLLDLSAAIVKLRATSAYLPEDLVQRALDRDRLKKLGNSPYPQTNPIASSSPMSVAPEAKGKRSRPG